MKQPKHQFHDGRSGAAVTVRVKPGAKHNRLRDILPDGTLQIDLTVADAEAVNRALVDFLSTGLMVAADQVEILGGLSGNDKIVAITGLDRDTVETRILAQRKTDQD